MQYANVNGEKGLPQKGLWGICPACGQTVVSKCGDQVVHHWAHKAGSDCDVWSEPVGPWHLEWQNCVQPEFVEVVKGPHRADIVGIDNRVIELQHSSIPLDHVAEREKFYGDMLWVFDATERFEMIPVGRRTFFAFGRTKYIGMCRRPVFLDFGSVLVEVEEFSGAIAKVDGFGRTRSREWFVERYLSDRLQEGACLPCSRSGSQCRWHGDSRYAKTKHASQWIDPETTANAIVPTASICIPLDWCFKQPGKPSVPEWEKILDRHPQIANGWTKSTLDAMTEFLNGEPMILDGFLRVMPSRADAIGVEMIVATTRDRLAIAEEHIAAGRIPILKETTKQQLITNAEAYERRTYGELLENLSRARPLDEKQKRLFG
jgi:hypothetical protein